MIGTIEMQNYDGVCKYCGTIQPVMAADQRDANEKISHDCECGGEVGAKKRNKMLDNLDAIAGEQAVKSGFKRISSDVVFWLKRGGEFVLDEKIDKISISISGTKIDIAITAKGDVKAKRSQTDSMTLEA